MKTSTETETDTPADRTKMQQMLEANIPDEVVSTRKAWGGGPELSYLSSFEVIDQMNKIFGNGGWGYTITDLRQVGESVQIKDKWQVSYLARVMISSAGSYLRTSKSSFIDIEDVGYGNGYDKVTAGAAHELAAKEAVTDALKRCCKSLGRRLGLALYDKTQAFVGVSTGVSVGVAPSKVEAKPKALPKTKVVMERIVKTSRALQESGKASREELEQEMQEEYGVTRVDQLTPAQLKKFADRLTERLTAATNS